FSIPFVAPARRSPIRARASPNVAVINPARATQVTTDKPDSPYHEGDAVQRESPHRPSNQDLHRFALTDDLASRCPRSWRLCSVRTHLRAADHLIVLDLYGLHEAGAIGPWSTLGI